MEYRSILTNVKWSGCSLAYKKFQHEKRAPVVKVKNITDGNIMSNPVIPFVSAGRRALTHKGPSICAIFSHTTRTLCVEL